MTTNPTGSSAPKVETTRIATPCGTVPNPGLLGDIRDGKFVGISGDKLVMTTVENKQCSFSVAPDVFVCCDGVTCGIQDLKAGSKIRLTTQVDDKSEATNIEALINQIDFADHH